MKSRLYNPLLALAFLLGACVPASQHLNEVRNEETDLITVGTVQKEIRIGMSSAEVVEALSSPNIITTDSERREVWIYDKISSEIVRSSSSGGVSALVIGYTGNTAGGIAPSYSENSSATSTQSRTLTIIIKFDIEGMVRDFSYRSSSF
jgi:hypothetical protein